MTHQMMQFGRFKATCEEHNKSVFIPTLPNIREKTFETLATFPCGCKRKVDVPLGEPKVTFHPL